MYQHGYRVGRYISLEKIIEVSKEDYYRILKEASTGWHDENHNLLSWWNYFLGVIKLAYQSLKDKVEFAESGDNQSSLIRQAILSFEEIFGISDIAYLHPSIYRELLKKVFVKLKSEGRIRPLGKENICLANTNALWTSVVAPFPFS